MDKINRYTVLPEDIIKAIDNHGFSKIMRSKAIKCVSIIINKGMQNNFDLQTYIELPKNYMKKSFGTHYHNDFFNELKRMGIIEVNHDYLPMYGKGKSKSYRIHSDYLSSSYVPTSYSSDSSSDSYLHVCGSVFEKAILFDDLKQLSIDEKKLWKATQDRMEAVSVMNFKTDHEVTANWMEVSYDGVVYTGTRNDIMTLAKLKGLTLIQDGSKYYVDDLDRYVETKKTNIKDNYRYTLAKLSKGIYYANRNNTNNRLDHNLTSMCSHLLNIIKEDNNLVEIDLCNSQFAILSHEMKKAGIETEDAQLFYKLSANGHLYEFIQVALEGISSQPGQKPKIGKQIMFELCFSSHKNTTTNKTKLKEIFPSVVAFIDEYKKKSKHYSEFAIMLQKTESEIFIDGLYHNLKQLGYWVVTKHDSLLIKKSDYEKVKEYVLGYFNTLNFKCSLSN